METFDAATTIAAEITALGADLAVIAPVAVGVSLAAFGVKWLLRNGKSVANK